MLKQNRLDDKERRSKRRKPMFGGNNDFFFTKDKNDGKHNYGIQFLTEEILSNINQEHEPLCFVQTLITEKFRLKILTCRQIV